MTNEELDNAREIEAIRIYDLEQDNPKGHGVARIAARLAREGWTPPVAVDPDKAEAITLAKGFGMAHYIPVLEAIKRGRALAAAEAKPGMVWVKHDGTRNNPLQGHNSWILVDRVGRQLDVYWSGNDWIDIRYYAIITQPEDAA
jgi:hypothetical protein